MLCCSWCRWRSGRRVVCCWAGLLGVPVGGGLPACVACGPTGVPGAVGPGRPRDRHTRACGSEWSISKPARALRTLRRPPHQWCLVAVCAGVWRPSCLCCLWPHGCSGRRRARPPARSPHASLRLGVVDLEARPCPPDPPAPSTPVVPGRCVCRCVAARPRAVRAASFARRVLSKPGQALPSLRRPRVQPPRTSLLRQHPILHVIPPRLFQTLNSDRWNCNVLRLC